MILEVDLEYPEELHDLHNDFSLAPDKMRVEPSTFSDWCTRAAGVNLKASEPKLIPTLSSKRNYVFHWQNLLLYLSLDLKVTKIYRGLCFRESACLKEYIEFNIQKRSHAKDAFDAFASSSS